MRTLALGMANYLPDANPSQRTRFKSVPPPPSGLATDIQCIEFALRPATLPVEYQIVPESAQCANQFGRWLLQ